ncbi:MAG: TetR/AcrR family transcriptional regulator [Rhodoglobus sp.]
MKSQDRRESILEAATGVFGDYGYVGATTDQVARAAGVSQPYVVRMFGSKEKLFLEVLRRALDLLLAAFRQVLVDYARDELPRRFGRAYVDLLNDRGLLLSLMHSYVMGSDPVIGRAAREGFLEVYEFLRKEAGFGAEEVRQFLAGGMLINTMVGVRMSDDFETNPLARELLTTALPEKLDLLLHLGKTQKPESR